MLLDQTHPAVEKLIRREIESAKQQMAGEGGREVAVMTESSSTDPAKAIVRMAASWNADLLVTGNRRARAWRVWEKSVSRAIVRAAPISVAGVPDADVPVPVEPNPMQRIIAATDLSPHGNAAVACALSLAPPDSSVVIVHVFDQEHVPEEERRRVMEGLSGMVVRRDLLERRVAARVELITSDDPARAILDLADQQQTDLLCVAARGRSRLPRFMLGSTAQKILLFSRRPVLVVP